MKKFIAQYKIFLIVCVVVWMTNYLPSWVQYGFHLNIIHIINPINIINNINPLHFISLIERYIFGSWWIGSDIPFSRYIIGIPLWIIGPFINLYIAKLVEKNLPKLKMSVNNNRDVEKAINSDEQTVNTRDMEMCKYIF